MNKRIKTLREKSLNAVPYISEERAKLLTKFYKQKGIDELSIPVQRAMALSYILNNKEIYIGKGELIVGERGPKPKATPSYPEICVHTPEDLQVSERQGEGLVQGIESYSKYSHRRSF